MEGKESRQSLTQNESKKGDFSSLKFALSEPLFLEIAPDKYVAI